MRRCWIASALLSVSLGAPTAAFAARAEMSQVGAKYPFDWYSVLWVTAAPGERNDIVVEGTADGIRVTDSAPVTPGGFCNARPDGSVRCEADRYFPLEQLRIAAGDLDDSVRAEWHGRSEWEGSTYLTGGSGDDVLAQGGASATTFAGGVGDDRMTGGPGADRFLEGAVANGSDLIMGGGNPFVEFDSMFPDQHVLRVDEVLYTERTSPIHADLEGDRDDGEPGEGDQIGSDVESIFGGAAPDRLAGSAAANRLDGGYGADLVIGGGGSDVLLGGVRRDASADRLDAGQGDDYLYGGGGGDRLRAGPGVDEVRGGEGRDLVWPGPGNDRIFGGPGNDILRTRDHVFDLVVCGRGWDRVRPDRADLVEGDCERDLSRRRPVRR